MTDYPGLQVEKRGSTAVVTLSNPPANTWTRDSLDALVRLVDDLEADAGIRALVLVGEGASSFAPAPTSSCLLTVTVVWRP